MGWLGLEPSGTNREFVDATFDYNEDCACPCICTCMYVCMSHLIYVHSSVHTYVIRSALTVSICEYMRYTVVSTYVVMYKLTLF